jgi:hypothetical protein
MPAVKYDLSGAQVNTPLAVLRFFWQLLKKHRPQLGRVLDLGAGDGRFARYGHFQEYVGVEIDRKRLSTKFSRNNASVMSGCAFTLGLGDYDACIGNPPYLRHHAIESPWKEKTLASLGKGLGIELNGHGNLFLYFLALGLLQARADGLVAFIIPFEWTSRPSARALRDLIRKKKWAVSVYRFRAPVFEGVTTTASISIIDKAKTDRKWHIYDVREDLSVVERRGLTGTGRKLLPYQRNRGRVFARRGMSPGTQKVFTLTEGERVHHGLHRADVVPCITSLRDLPAGIDVLDEKTFKEHFVDAGRRCWLIKTRGELSDRLRSYVRGVPAEERATSTCRARRPWYRYEKVDPPRVLLHSGFSGDRPKVLINRIAATPVGAMYGVYATASVSGKAILEFITGVNVLDIIVPNSGRLRKIEVGQLNSLLAEKWPKKR